MYVYPSAASLSKGGHPGPSGSLQAQSVISIAHDFTDPLPSLMIECICMKHHGLGFDGWCSAAKPKLHQHRKCMERDGRPDLQLLALVDPHRQVSAI
ncbi:hypothetical protein ACFX13_040535 [Malus domestica]